MVDGKKRLFATCLLVSLIFIFMITPITVSAESETGEERVVKVGYLITPGFQEGGKGEYKTGQGYEYLQKIAGYNGWTYEYVYGNFDELFEKLQNGEIDIMGNVSYTKEREKTISYGKNVQGKEAFYLYVNGTDSSIDGSDYSTLNGKKIGLTKGTYQTSLWKKWCAEKNIGCTQIEYDSDDEIEKLLNDGELDGAVRILMLNRTNETANWRSVLKFGEAPYYFAVNKKKPQLLAELNYAQDKILNENPYYNEELATRYLRTDNLPSKQFEEMEEKWLKKHKSSIKVGCLNGYLPISAEDSNGKMKGVIPDILSIIEKKDSDYDIKFTIVSYDDYDKMVEGLKRGDIDIVSPVYGDYWNADKEGICLTDSFLSTTMLLLHQGEYSPKKIKKIGVDMRSPLQIAYAEIYYSAYEIITYPSIDDSAKALKKGEIDASLCSACAYHVAAQNNKIIRDLNRVTLPGNVNISMAVSKDEPALMSIMNSGFALVGETEIFNSLAMHSNVERKYTLWDFVLHNPAPVIIIFIVICLILTLIIIRLMQAIKKSNTDSMTGLLNKTAMCNRIKDHLQQGGVLFMIDIDNFKEVNDILGHKEGDYLITGFSSSLEKIFSAEDVIGRFGGDEFMVFLPETDLTDELIAKKVDQMQRVVADFHGSNKKEPAGCSLSVGVLRIKANNSMDYTEAFEKVDAALYEAKHCGKNTYVIAE